MSSGQKADQGASQAPIFILDGPIAHDGGVGYRCPIPSDALALLDEHPFARANATITENGVALDPREAPHDLVRECAGAYSVWDRDVFFAASDGSDCRTNGRTYAMAITDPSQIQVGHGAFELERPYIEDGGLAVRTPLPLAAALAVADDPLLGECSIVLEDGVPLTTPDAQHQTIREMGLGRFCVWGTHVYFSSSDGTPCATNGRRYEVLVPDPPILRAISSALASHLASNDEALLPLVQASMGTNNTFANNFLSQCTPALRYLRQHEGGWQRALVLGCGQRPWAPLRLLAEGFNTVIANDLMAVEERFDPNMIDPALEMVRNTAPVLGERLDALMQVEGEAGVTFRGLEVRSATLFEDLPEQADSVDFLFSNSVLEHVMNPERVYQAMAKFLRPGGVSYHVIDLRDHLHWFDPLRFLGMSEAEYNAINTENRLRAQDHLRLAADAGLDPEVLWIKALAPDGGLRGIDGEPPSVTVSQWSDVRPAVTPALRATFDLRFHDHDLRDLSVIGLTVVFRKMA